MRLTLRTLLAYLDQILDEEDAKELETKIQESEVATQLVQRIRKSLKQRNANALSLVAEGLGNDANSVAEYLDNTLSADQIPDFERLCLESDDHLAELSSCHQILTLVLGEPADVPIDLKQRIYQLKEMAKTKSVENPQTFTKLSSGTHVRVDEPPSAPARDEDERWTEAPDYLKRPRPKKWAPIAVTAMIVFCLAMAALLGMGPLNNSHPLAKRLGFGTEAETESNTVVEAEDSTIPSESDPVTEQPPEVVNSVAKTPTVNLDDSAALVNDLETANDDAVTESVEQEDASLTPDFGPTENSDLTDSQVGRIDEVIVAPATDPVGETLLSDDPQVSEATPLADTTTELDADIVVATDKPISDRTGVDHDEVPNPNDLALTDAELLAPPTLLNPLDGVFGDRPNIDSSQPPAEPADTSDAVAPEQSEQPPIVDIGRFLDEQQVLVKFNPDSQTWNRVGSGTGLQAGNQLMSLPTFRAPLTLASGMHVTLVGATRIELMPPTIDENPFVELYYGRLAVATFSQSGTRFGLSWGNDRNAVITLTDMNTTFAVELLPQQLPGGDPTGGNPHLVLYVYVTSGNAEWNAPDSPPIQMSAGQRLTVVNESEARLNEIEDYPLWIDGRDRRPRDPIAADELSKKLTANRPVSLVLHEESESRRQEVRSLAVCCLAQFGDYSPLVVALNDPKLRSYWGVEYQTLVEAINRSPQDATAAWQAIERQHGENDGQTLYRMTWSYDPAQLEEFGAEQLVSCLEHPSFDFRVAASETLKTITGLPSLYRAHATDRDPQRRTAIVRWRRHLNNGEIVYAERPKIVDLLTTENPPPAPQPTSP